MPFDRDKMRRAASKLANQGIFIGTSSWKYPGWRGLLYDDSRYIWRGRFSQARLEKYCLTEYAQVFKTVCVDAAYYKFPEADYLHELASQVSPDFQFAFKVTDQITLKRFPNLPRFGPRAGVVNGDFLNAPLFQSDFLTPMKSISPRVGLLIFEFSRFYPGDFARGRDFVEALDTFLSQLPKSYPYGIEVRNAHFLHPEYFALLARHQVAHVYNSWQDMPSIAEQMAIPDSRTHPSLVGARFLLRPGRSYEQAVKSFSPYDRIKDPYPEGRAAASALVRQSRDQNSTAKTFIYINNRFEGNALETLDAIVDAIS
jgi:uncharacterized protein YecE (DUF72 family)